MNDPPFRAIKRPLCAHLTSSTKSPTFIAKNRPLRAVHRHLNYNSVGNFRVELPEKPLLFRTIDLSWRRRNKMARLRSPR
ncbi:hypothetical protein JTE90_000305 [Oedothorax gibbosus]|uniref:Uncharacterized protein n=1 Tax=Oedothorax gibbosus TaxID=931172 RepID=A0AAV6VRE1_9ARAC|nr:hypothetical protein JTE90_000305 [Oedothorax gibbosus]